MQRLRKLDVVLNPKSSGPGVVDSDMIDDVHRKLDADKFDILATHGTVAVGHRQA